MGTVVSVKVYVNRLCYDYSAYIKFSFFIQHDQEVDCVAVVHYNGRFRQRMGLKHLNILCERLAAR